MLQRFSGLAAALILLASAACSSFEQQWRDAANLSSAHRMVPMVGRWEGTWHSDQGQGGGGLRAIITISEAPSSTTTRTRHYNALFKSVYLGFLSGEYTLELVGHREDDGSISFRGQKDLGTFAGGTYHFEGVVRGNDFTARYASSGDRGDFTMKRLGW